MLRRSLEECLNRIALSEPDVQAWTSIDPQPAIAPGPLNGIPFGAKDIFETANLPTEYGSSLYRGRVGSCDARVVADLRRLGAILVGKTQTAAFASFDPAVTRNPRFPGHTPGGSSSGSAAAVAAGMVPFALGTQTLGSVIRPASYCAVCGFKPTFHYLSTEGVMPFAPSLDTVGLFTESAAEMQELCRVAFSLDPPGELPRRALRLRLPCEEPMQRAIDNAVSRLRACGFAVDELDPPEGWDRLIHAARTINAFEGARTQYARYAEFGEKIGGRLAELVRAGLALPEAGYDAARAHIDEMGAVMARLFDEYPVMATPAATGPAPATLASTGDPVHNAPWTALGAPAITIPMPATGGPLGLQLTAAPGADALLLAVAVQAQCSLESPS